MRVFRITVHKLITGKVQYIVVSVFYNIWVIRGDPVINNWVSHRKRKLHYNRSQTKIF